MIYNLLNNAIEEDEDINNLNNNILNSNEQIENVEINPVILDIKFDFCGLNKMFKLLRPIEINTIIHANIFSNFNPDWNYFHNNLAPRDNIFNTYTKFSKIYKKIKNLGKIKENTKSKINYKSRRLYKCIKIYNMSNRNVIRIVYISWM
jgi:hypothetical protein